MNKSLQLLLVIALAGLASPAMSFAAPKGNDPLVVSHGEKIDLAGYLVPGKTTIVDFTSQYCGPCQSYTEPLHKLHQKRADVAVVKVDINRPGIQKIDWKSPVAGQYGLRSIPQFKVFGPGGKLLAEGKEARAMVDRWIKQNR